jgi:hypothetical protein
MAQFKTALVMSPHRGKPMKVLLMLLTIGILTASAPPQAIDAGSTQMVTNIIETGGYSGIADKQLSRMGDSAAVEVARVIAGRSVTAHEVDGILTVLHLAFSNPKLVETTSDRTPRVALFVLQYLTLVATDANVKARISETKTYMESLVRATHN